MSRRINDREEGIDRHFEGRARLEKLLTVAGSVADAQDVFEAFREAQKNAVPSSVVIDALFDEEPRFSSPTDARALYGNLFGLWDLLAAGQSVDLERPPTARAPKPPPPEPPEPFADAPDEAWVERGWKYLDLAPKRERQRLSDAFENRQDALLSWLDQSGLTDAAFALARDTLFEAFALLELGDHRAGAARPLSHGAVEVPPALAARAEEHLFEAEHDEQHPLVGDPLEAARKAVIAGLAALWAATKK